MFVDHCLRLLRMVREEDYALNATEAEWIAHGLEELREWRQEAKERQKGAVGGQNDHE